jgi:outer membrane receptor for Fe3+-dicitrate
MTNERSKPLKVRTFKGVVTSLFGLQLCISTPLLQAQPEFEYDEEELMALYGDEELISIATGSLQPIAKAPSTATVITAREIKAMGATDIDQVLETVTGLHVARSNIMNNPLYTFRGIYTSFNPQVLMMINGIPIKALLAGDRNQIWGGATRIGHCPYRGDPWPRFGHLWGRRLCWSD